MTASSTSATDQTAHSAAPRLHFLLAMCYLVHRTGAELFTRDIALWLRHRGHSVTIFATAFGEMADELRHESIACITDPAQLARRPDVILGSTHHETVRAILHFPDVPAISICHDRNHEHGRPPRLSQVRQFVAVDENCAERLCHEHGIAPENVRVIPNGVDLLRFKRRDALPEEPKRALVFSSYAQDDALLDEIRTACSARGMQLDAIGSGVNNLVREPAALLAEYDLVFAKGRSATEALAVGCACILLDHSQRSMGYMIDRATMENARRWNYGRALLTRPITPAALSEEIARYDRADASAVTDWVRLHAGLDVTGSALERVALDLVQTQPVIAVAPDQQISELLRYMSEWVAANHPTGEHLLIAQLRDEVLRQHQALDDMRRNHAHVLQSDRTRNQAQVDTLLDAHRISLDAAQTNLQATQMRLAASEEHVQSAQNRLRESNEEISQLKTTLSETQDAAQEKLAQLLKEIQQGSERERALAEKLGQSELAMQNATFAHQAQLSQHRDRIDALLGSVSWRIAAPLRAALTLIKRFFG
jgi:glycosyltransferase involved in cell wall biosynthesis